MCAFVLGAAALATRSDDAVSGVLVCGPGARNAIVWGPPLLSTDRRAREEQIAERLAG